MLAETGVTSVSFTMIRLMGQVQGVGMRPTIWRIANEMNLDGQVFNQGSDVLVEIHDDEIAAKKLLSAIMKQKPVLADIQSAELVTEVADSEFQQPGFTIGQSAKGKTVTTSLPDAVTCAECMAEVNDPASRYYRYPFTSCINCGPRLSIQTSIPWDRANSSMRRFALCNDCRLEYDDPIHRRFHAESIACPVCGPLLQLVDNKAAVMSHQDDDEISACQRLLAEGCILAIKSLGGFHLACDATNEDAVARLRKAKRRESKPFALMARNIEIIEQYCDLSECADEIKQTLSGPAGPIIILPRHKQAPKLAAGIAPGLNDLGMMLPGTALHHILLEGFDHPLVMTSGNLTGSPPVTENKLALERLAGVADAFLIHDRAIENRLDDSVLRPIAGELRMIRLARGYAPRRIPLPPGLKTDRPILAVGAELKSSFCLLNNQGAILGQHIGDLEDVENLDEYERALSRYQNLFRFAPCTVAVDCHPEYLSRKRALKQAREQGQSVIEVQHHHAHIVSCMTENGLAVNSQPVLGIALDGLGYGQSDLDDDKLWGGEFLLADYQEFERVGHLQQMPLIGAKQAMQEPWRNTWAHLITVFGSRHALQQFRDLQLIQWLQQQPLDSVDSMLQNNVNCPMTSSAGRWFDAVAAAINLCRAKQDYEGHAAMQLEALVDKHELSNQDCFYPFTILEQKVPVLTVNALWPALLNDLQQGVSPAFIAARFHGGFAWGLTRMVEHLLLQKQQAKVQVPNHVVLSGGVFQNAVLCELLSQSLEALGLNVLMHNTVPANDGGIALGQACIAATQMMNKERATLCA